MPRKLEFYAEKTAVHSGENCSFVSRNFSKATEQFFFILELSIKTKKMFHTTMKHL